MKTLLVFALVAAVSATDMMKEEKKEELKLVSPISYGLPLTYNAMPYYNTLPIASTYATYPYVNTLPITYKAPEIKPVEIKPVEYKLPEIKPLTYTYQPVQTKLVPKEYEIPVPTVEFEPVDSECTNVFGFKVPCKKTKRSAEEEKEMEEMKTIMPLTYNSAFPLAYNAMPYYNTLPYVNTLPYAAIPRPVEVKTLEPKIQEVPYLKPVFKKVVNKVKVGPACFNAAGLPVPCAQYE